MANKRLVGSDGKIIVGTYGTAITGGADTVAGTWYRVDAIDDTASALPAGVEVGYLWFAVGTTTLVDDDTLAPFTGSALCDVQSFSMEWSKAEVDVTTMCDTEMVFRAGKTDVSGSIEGVFTMGITNLAGGLLNQFVTIVAQNDATASPGDYVVNIASDATVLGQLYVDDTTTAGESEAFYLVPMSLTGFSASAGGEDAQTFSSPFRVAPSDTGVVFYSYVNPTV